MRTLIPFITLALVACGYSQDKFEEDFAAKFCETYESEACGSQTCPDATGTGTGTGEVECEFDSKKAKECIDAEWECTDLGGGIMLPVPAAVCAEVCPVSGTTDTTGGTTAE